MTRLKIGIQRVGKIVFGKVLEQDDLLRRGGVLACGNGVCVMIESVASPQLYPKVLFIRGSISDNDTDWFAYSYPSEKDAIQVVKDIRALVLKVNDGPISSSQEHCGLEIIE